MWIIYEELSCRNTGIETIGWNVWNASSNLFNRLLVFIERHTTLTETNIKSPCRFALIELSGAKNPEMIKLPPRKKLNYGFFFPSLPASNYTAHSLSCDVVIVAPLVGMLGKQMSLLESPQTWLNVNRIHNIEKIVYHDSWLSNEFSGENQFRSIEFGPETCHVSPIRNSSIHVYGNTFETTTAFKVECVAKQ